MAIDLKHVGKTALSSVTENAIRIADTLGRAGLHALLPENFEYYMCSLELLDDNGNTKGFLMFPVMPSNVVETKTAIASVTKTNAGVVTLFNPTFVPRDISIQGTFGRKLRLLTGSMEVDDNQKSWFNKAASGDLGFGMFGTHFLVKTGYGLIKMLEKMTDKLYELDENGKPYVMVFSNYALDTHYVVEVLQRSFSQDEQNNMLWYYNLEMKAIAPAAAVKSTKRQNKEYWKRVASGSIAKSISGILSDTAVSLMQF